MLGTPMLGTPMPCVPEAPYNGRAPHLQCSATLGHLCLSNLGQMPADHPLVRRHPPHIPPHPMVSNLGFPHIPTSGHVLTKTPLCTCVCELRDPATGLGTPRFDKLLAAAMA